jgi:hypothetical protein
VQVAVKVEVEPVPLTPPLSVADREKRVATLLHRECKNHLGNTWYVDVWLSTARLVYLGNYPNAASCVVDYVCSPPFEGGRAIQQPIHFPTAVFSSRHPVRYHTPNVVVGLHGRRNRHFQIHSYWHQDLGPSAPILHLSTLDSPIHIQYDVKIEFQRNNCFKI